MGPSIEVHIQYISQWAHPYNLRSYGEGYVILAILRMGAHGDGGNV